MFNFNSWTSPQTATSWRGIGPNKPFGLILTTLFVTIITLIVTIILNITSANESGNDYGEGTGWIVMTPGPAATLLWTISCIFICRYGKFTPSIALGTYLVIALGIIAEGVVSILLYDWHEIAWLPGVFMLILGIDCIVFCGYAIAALRRQDKPKDIALDYS
ncbi:hypothetical protein H072_4121 [Dactylellina haptotyla CBS 200.50]|uniref:MARVEL domain-containing protein n=1 Tax=Dactylellina haptotyla (strain CBS 200.50) TaxID=1284197 RepID=S8C2P4_DACHA|nr:hypothetical protein H072_4121 [Dactylellina haptotyla CBS 200.50]